MVVRPLDINPDNFSEKQLMILLYGKMTELSDYTITCAGQIEELDDRICKLEDCDNQDHAIKEAREKDLHKVGKLLAQIAIPFGAIVISLIALVK